MAEDRAATAIRFDRQTKAEIGLACAIRHMKQNDLVVEGAKFNASLPEQAQQRLQAIADVMGVPVWQVWHCVVTDYAARIEAEEAFGQPRIFREFLQMQSGLMYGEEYFEQRRREHLGELEKGFEQYLLGQLYVGVTLEQAQIDWLYSRGTGPRFWTEQQAAKAAEEQQMQRAIEDDPDLADAIAKTRAQRKRQS